MRSNFRKVLIEITSAAAFIGLTGCAMSPPKSLMDIQAGDTFHLKQAVTVPAGKARQFIQFGQLTGSGFDRREPHCRIEIYALQKQPYTIRPQVFQIKQVQLGEEQIAHHESAPLQLAYNQYHGTISDGIRPEQWLAMSYEAPETMDLVHLYLKSESQPNVYRLTCAGALSNGDPMDAPRSERPQRAKINTILGPVGQVTP